MESIDRWLKSLRLHKYTPIFKKLTYEQMLNLEEKYLIDLDITKGARNKIMVSIKKLNLRQDRLINMMDDMNQDNISMKEALTVLKDMLMTPIPSPPATRGGPTPISPYTITPVSLSSSDYSSSASSSSSSSSSASSGIGAGSGRTTSDSNSDISSIISNSSPIPSSPDSLSDYSKQTASQQTHYYTEPNELTHLFVETFVMVARRLIESAGHEDNACHGIMAAIVDECLKHNSFTKGQKATVARFRQHFAREQKAKTTNLKYGHHNQHHQQQPRQLQQLQNYPPHQVHRSLSLRPYHQVQHQDQFQYNQRYRAMNIHSHHYQQQQQLQQHQQQTNYNRPSYRQKPVSPSSLSASTVGSAGSNSDEEDRQASSYREYSLLGPGMTFELPCLRAKAEAEKHNGNRLVFFSD